MPARQRRAPPQRLSEPLAEAGSAAPEYGSNAERAERLGAALAPSSLDALEAALCDLEAPLAAGSTGQALAGLDVRWTSLVDLGAPVEALPAALSAMDQVPPAQGSARALREALPSGEGLDDLDYDAFLAADRQHGEAERLASGRADGGAAIPELERGRIDLIVGWIEQLHRLVDQGGEGVDLGLAQLVPALQALVGLAKTRPEVADALGPAFFEAFALVKGL
ncbi:MAG: hypothetical protein JXX28_01690 [Deltaproteobacteria bacterium]|nr:hypothetical protein [Deltaproteobacteria bacterium]